MNITRTCSKCQRRWQYFRLQNDSVGYCIRLPNGRCEDPLLYWKEGGICPRCAGFSNQLRSPDLVWLGIRDGDRVAYFMDVEDP